MLAFGAYLTALQPNNSNLQPNPKHPTRNSKLKTSLSVILTVHATLTHTPAIFLKKWQKKRHGTKYAEPVLPHKIPFVGKSCSLTKTKIVHTSMKPIADRVIIKPAPADEKTKGGLIIPDTAKEKPQRGEVIAVGPGKDGNLMTVTVGDIVLYGKYSGQEINYEGYDYLIMREDDILCII